MPMQVPLYTARSGKAPAIKTAKPRVIIPVFPGTNCEVDTARAFEKAGALPQILLSGTSPRRILSKASARLPRVSVTRKY
jgi:phosphoribosylformylglycinamidine synthase